VHACVRENLYARLSVRGCEVGQGLPKKKTDYGTVIFHWALAASLAVAVATGLRIATETPGRDWLNFFNFFLPKAAVWTEHLQAAVLLTGISVAYVVYVWRARLWPRLRLDGVRLRGLFGRRYARWGTLNIALYWLLFLALLTQFGTGLLLYLGRADSITARMHWFGMWFIFGYVVIHIFSQWRYGGAAQLLRIFRPGRLTPPPPPFDIGEILALLDDQISQSAVPSQTPLAYPLRHSHQPAGQLLVAGRADEFQALRVDAREPVADERIGGSNRTSIVPSKRPGIQLNAFVVACVVAALTAISMIPSKRALIETLYVRRIDPAVIPTIDGETSDPVWRMIPPLYVLTENGGNFGGTGETTVSIRAAHDGTRAYFLFIWDDPTRSLKQLPLQKMDGSWRLLHDGYEIGDEHAYNEDKFAVLLTRLHTILAGDTTFHAGAKPLEDEPPGRSGRGLHYTAHDGLFAEVWDWKAASTNASHHCDDDYFGPPVSATAAQQAGLSRYRGGFAHAPGTANYRDNFTTSQPNDYADGILPRRLPKDFNAMTAALGRVDLNPDDGETEGARWYMTEAESVPYSTERDRSIPEGALIPGVVISGEYSGNRAAVECAGHWAAGRWALEVTRRLDVAGPYDVPIQTGTFMRVAAFDHTQIQHTRHVRPIRLELH
jgi:ethylbenzene dehydrogenase/cytochrome b561-like protein